MSRFIMEPYFQWEGHDTAVPFVETIGTFFYRTDLLKDNEVPRTWDELVRTSSACRRTAR